MKRRAPFTAAAAVFAGIAISLLAPSMAAVGQSSPPQTAVRIAGRATLVARGAAVAVPVHVTINCEPGTQPNLQVQVAEVVNGKVAHAFGSTSDLPCDGISHTVTVFAVSADLQLHTGPAFAQANLFACSFFFPPSPGCTATDAREIRIVNR